MMSKTAITLGTKVRDRVSGFTGLATGRAEYLYTTPTVEVTPDTIGTDGKLIGAVWLEEAQLEPAGEKSAAGYRPAGEGR